jgi:pimeloyl-ACP methyl ester carboxylesterase
MTDFLLIHGAWHGGWCWRAVEHRLHAMGHRVAAPCLPGLGSRAHELSASIGLAEHVAAVRGILSALERPIVVAHSYGGMLARILEDKSPHLMRAVVYLEALVPEGTASVLDLLPAGRAQEFAAMAAQLGDGWRLPPPSDMKILGITDPVLAAYTSSRLRDHPFKTFQDSAQVTSHFATAIKHYYVFGADRDPQPLRAVIDRFERRPEWNVIGLTGGHDIMLTNPDGLSDLLLGNVLKCTNGGAKI